ncbi:iron-sulfur cluster assembly protein [Methylomagnum ishizawai]|uniref:Iron-sulfur cluster assembly protein n=1 Tax=Methylomagnum ishizawai TaxID=1760988 RepID=A0A1Y6CYX5_9GAMM|nr:iron-sulfur cluster assembly accessory protein [Methylomagnum ishizawai]SMF93522.1 iron-sulfur cluster assembly protein [Methylomagnum ishizawai]
MSIILTEPAATQVSKQLAKRGTGLGLRLGVKPAGCTGFAYVVDYADAIEADDTVFEQHGAKVVVKQGDLAYLDGVEIDFRREGISEAFKFHNPNIKATCGCGESFAV